MEYNYVLVCGIVNLHSTQSCYMRALCRRWVGRSHQVRFYSITFDSPCHENVCAKYIVPCFMFIFMVCCARLRAGALVYNCAGKVGRRSKFLASAQSCVRKCFFLWLSENSVKAYINWGDEGCRSWALNFLVSIVYCLYLYPRPNVFMLRLILEKYVNIRKI